MRAPLRCGLLFSRSSFRSRPSLAPRAALRICGRSCRRGFRSLARSSLRCMISERLRLNFIFPSPSARGSFSSVVPPFVPAPAAAPPSALPARQFALVPRAALPPVWLRCLCVGFHSVGKAVLKKNHFPTRAIKMRHLSRFWVL